MLWFNSSLDAGADMQEFDGDRSTNGIDYGIAEKTEGVRSDANGHFMGQTKCTDPVTITGGCRVRDKCLDKDRNIQEPVGLPNSDDVGLGQKDSSGHELISW